MAPPRMPEARWEGPVDLPAGGPQDARSGPWPRGIPTSGPSACPAGPHNAASVPPRSGVTCYDAQGLLEMQRGDCGWGQPSIMEFTL